MLGDNLPFRVVQFTGIVQDGSVDFDLADIMQVGSVLQMLFCLEAASP